MYLFGNLEKFQKVQTFREGSQINLFYLYVSYFQIGLDFHAPLKIKNFEMTLKKSLSLSLYDQ